MSIVASFTLLLLVLAASSLTWRMEHDVPLAHYSAFMLAEHGTAPYRDLFETNYPGTILAHLGITRFFGYGDRGVMLANLVWFLLLASATAKLMRPWGRLVAWGSVVVPGVTYFGFGSRVVLQRDGLAVLPIVVALALYTANRPPSPTRRFSIGLLLGCAASIKPHTGVALLPMLGSEGIQLLKNRNGTPGDSVGSLMRMAAGVFGPYVAGAFVTMALVVTWLAASGGTGAWLEMTREYLPLHLSMTGTHETIAGLERVLYLFRQMRYLGGHSPWLLAAGVGCYLALVRDQGHSRRQLILGLLLGETLVFSVYPALAGQFWDYHYFPLLFFLMLLSSLCLSSGQRIGAGGAAIWFPRFALLISFALGAPFGFVTRQLSMSGEERRATDARRDQVDEIASFLKTNLRPGDTVQPLDWTGGAVQAMLMARARLATRFLYDYHFYHHVSHPFIRLLRARFLADLTDARPRFIVEYFGENKPWPTGSGTSREFPELARILATDYDVVASGREYRIYRRLRGPPATEGNRGDRPRGEPA